MQIKIQSDYQAIATADRNELSHRAQHWLRRVEEIIRSLYVRLTDASASARAGDRFCLIEAHMDNGLRLSAQARGRATIIAIDRALRRLARAIVKHLKRESRFRALHAGAM
jgi:ribosome-associated translation inhibitor RaiA